MNTPRTDEIEAKWAGGVSIKRLRDLSRQLELENAKLLAEIGPLREIVGVRCDAESTPADITNWLNLVSHADSAKRLKKQLADCQADRNRLYSQLNTLLAHIHAGSVPEYVVFDIKNPTRTPNTGHT